MTLIGTLTRTAAAALAVVAATAFLATVGAAADVKVIRINCQDHPRQIEIQNQGDSAQALAGWRLVSNEPDEVFALDVVGSIAPQERVLIANGHLAPATPLPPEVLGQWVYPWNPGSFDWAINEDGKDFIRIVDAGGNEVFAMPCPGTLEIPPLQQPETPTPPPSDPDPGSQDPGQPDGNLATAAQSDGAQSAGASQNVPASGNAAATSGSGSTTQTGNVSAQALGGPASGAGGLQLQVSGGPPLGGHLFPLGLLGVVAAAALALVGVRMLRRALRRP